MSHRRETEKNVFSLFIYRRKGQLPPPTLPKGEKIFFCFLEMDEKDSVFSL